MSLKKEIIALLKTKFPGVQLSTARVDAIATKIDAKITEESEIEGKLDELNDILPFADIAKQDDRVRTLEAEAKKPKPADPAKPDPANPTPPDPANPSPAPTTDPALLAILNEMKGELASLKGSKVADDRKSKLEALLKDAPEAYRTKALKDFSRMKFDTDEEFTEFLTDSETDAAAFIQEDAQGTVGSDKRPAGQGGAGGKDKPASKEELDGVMSGIKV